MRNRFEIVYINTDRCYGNLLFAGMLANKTFVYKLEKMEQIKKLMTLFNFDVYIE